LIWSPIDVATEFYDRGITGRTNQTLAVAICRAESGFDDQASLDNTKLTPAGKGTDRGLMQINSYWHPEVSDSCAYDGKCNITEAVRIFREHGNTFGGSSGWAAYNNGSYLKYMDLARVAVDADRRLRDLDQQLVVIAGQNVDLAGQNTSLQKQVSDYQETIADLLVKTVQQQVLFDAVKGRFDAWAAGIWNP
jgi:hypothetical protein